ncbi:MAG: HipA domain-containing protein [Acidobacteriota bacterium]|jgi:hypothetical protein|nr:HipA domain-containing protein [Acidobacteriota bacterium]
MRYILMHKNIEVAELAIDSATGGIVKIEGLLRPEHLPVGVTAVDGRADRKFLNDWWVGRAIPASRSGLRDALETLNVSSPNLLLTKCLGLSLSDQYGVRPAEKAVAWKNVNFFENGFSEDVGNALFGRAPEKASLDLMSPDNTSDGWLKKKWIIADRKRLLVKGGSPPAYQEPLNEALAAALMQRLGIPHVHYTLTWDNGQPLSVCEDFITPETELVSAWHILKTAKKPGHLSEYQHFLNRCTELGIPGMKESLDRMLAVDYMIGNADRHYNNFGAVRHAETLQWLGAAPIFDCGTSLWYDQFTHVIRPGFDLASKPFRRKHDEQIKLVTDFGWLDFDALRDIDTEYAEILRQSAYIDDARRKALCFALRSRIDTLKSFVTSTASQAR